MVHQCAIIDHIGTTFVADRTAIVVVVFVIVLIVAVVIVDVVANAYATRSYIDNTTAGANAVRRPEMQYFINNTVGAAAAADTAGG